MRRTLLLPLVMLAAAALRAEVEPTPDEAKVRARVDALIAAYEKAGKPATLGLLREAATVSIGFGAPAYNNGDHAACHRFYHESMQALLKAFGGEGKATPAAARQLKVFLACIARAEKRPNVDDKAWALRFGWDRTEVEWDLDLTKAAQLVQMSTHSLIRGHYDEAESAGREVYAAYADLMPSDPSAAPLSITSMGMTLTRALFAQEKFEDAAKMLAESFAFVPLWPTYDVNELEYFKDPETHAALLKKLEAAAAKAPEDAGLRRLLGHEYFNSQNPAQAQAEFLKVLELSPGDPVAAAYRKLAADSPEQKQIAAWIRQMGSEDFDQRAAASKHLEAQGRWALAALKKEFKRTQDPEIRTRCLDLLKKLSGDREADAGE
ncbi:MAG: hypothetical protein KIS92_11580 [Planctomycetota bacterium]|nr:hypothetical protein [Planctomycetota bacterium]